MKNVFLMSASSILVATLMSGCLWGDMNSNDKEKLKVVTTESLEKDCELATLEDVIFNLKLNGRDSGWKFYDLAKNGQIILKDGLLIDKGDNLYDFYEFKNGEIKLAENIIKVTKTESIVKDSYVLKACAKAYTDKEKEKIVSIDTTGVKNAKKSITHKIYQSSDFDKVLQKSEKLNEKHNEMLAIETVAGSQHILLPLRFGIATNSYMVKVYPDLNDNSSILRDLEKADKKLDDYIFDIKEKIKNH